MGRLKFQIMTLGSSFTRTEDSAPTQENSLHESKKKEQTIEDDGLPLPIKLILAFGPTPDIKPHIWGRNPTETELGPAGYCGPKYWLSRVSRHLGKTLHRLPRIRGTAVANEGESPSRPNKTASDGLFVRSSVLCYSECNLLARVCRRWWLHI